MVASKKETGRPVSQSRSWMLTVPAEFYDRQAVEEALAGYAYRGQLERGESGYKHWQLLVDGGRSPIRFSTLKKRLPKAHVEPRAATVEQALAYVTKEDSRVDGEEPLVRGEIAVRGRQGRRTDVEKVRYAIFEEGLSVDDVLLQVPEAARMTSTVEKLVAARDRQTYGKELRDLHVQWLFGPPGSGKTRRAISAGGDNFFRVTNYEHPFDAYASQSTLILDEFAGQLGLDTLLNLLDIYPLLLPARYMDKPAAYTKVVIVSNAAPWTFYRFEPAVRRAALARRVHDFYLVDAHGMQEVANAGARMVDPMGPATAGW